MNLIIVVRANSQERSIEIQFFLRTLRLCLCPDLFFVSIVWRSCLCVSLEILFFTRTGIFFFHFLLSFFTIFFDSIDALFSVLFVWLSFFSSSFSSSNSLQFDIFDHVPQVSVRVCRRVVKLSSHDTAAKTTDRFWSILNEPIRLGRCYCNLSLISSHIALHSISLSLIHSSNRFIERMNVVAVFVLAKINSIKRNKLNCNRNEFLLKLSIFDQLGIEICFFSTKHSKK